MQLASIKIAGIERIHQVLLRDMDITQDVGDRMGSARFLVLSDPSIEAVLGQSKLGLLTLGLAIVPGQTVEIYKTIGTPGTSGEEVGGDIFGEPLFGGEENIPSELFFAGRITLAQPRMMVASVLSQETEDLPAEFGDPEFGDPIFGGPLFGDLSGTARVNLTRVEARDWNSLLEYSESDITPLEYANTTDIAVLQALFTSYLPQVDISNLTSTPIPLVTFTIQDGDTIRAIIDRLYERTGREYYIDQNLKFHYFTPVDRPAAFSFSESPDMVTTFPLDRESFDYTMDWRTPANSVMVVGNILTGGGNLRVRVEDAQSIAAYGKFGRTITDRQVKSTAEARLRADVEIARNARPQIHGTLTHRKDGLSIGTYLNIDLPLTLHVNEGYVIRRLTVRWLNTTVTQWETEFGSYRPDIARQLRKLYDLAKPQGNPPVALPAPGTVTPGTFAGSLELIQPVATLPPLPDVAYSANAVVLLTTDRKLYRRNGNAWTAVVATTDLTGTILAAQIGANQVTAGKIAADAVIAGTIAVGAIRAVDFAFASGAIQTADIGNLQVNTAKIDNLAVKSINIDLGQVGTTQIANGGVLNVNVGTGISAAKLTVGDLTVGGASGAVGQITVLDGGGFGIGWIGRNGATYGGWLAQLYVGGTGPSNAKLKSLASGVLTIDLTDNDAFYLTASASSRVTRITNLGLKVYNLFDSNDFTSVQNGTVTARYGSSGGTANFFTFSNEGQCLVESGTGNQAILIAGSTKPFLNLNGFHVVREPRAGWQTATGLATRSSFDTGFVTLSQLAERVKALIDDLYSWHGLIRA